jgi:hypothetical protein
MRIFLIWSDESQGDMNLVSGLRQSGHEVIYWINTKENEGKFPGIIIHDHNDAWVGIPPKELATVEFDPPSEELINKLSGVESIIMTMMNKHFEGKCVDERKNLYYTLLGYWYGVLNKFKPEAVIFPAPPHPTFNYLIFELARMLKIKTLMFDGPHIADRLVWYNDFWQGSRVLQEELAKNQGKNFSLNDLNEDFQVYLKFQTDESNDTTPSYTKNDFKKNRLVNKIVFKIKILLNSLKNFTIFKKVFLYFRKLLRANIQKEYYRYSRQPADFSKKFIYVPLHYQPECNTSPQGGVFVNQILMIKILSAALPSGWIIYVKEHPAQWISFGINYTDYRYPGYYRQIAAIKNVRLVHYKTSSFSLVKQAQAVATVTGTAGWEAILRQKPVLIFGQTWYRDCAGVFKVNSVETCRSALDKIAGGYKPDFQSLINYLKCLEAATVRGIAEEWSEKNLKRLTKQEYFDNVLRVLNEELKKFV